METRRTVLLVCGHRPPAEGQGEQRNHETCMACVSMNIQYIHIQELLFQSSATLMGLK